MDAASVAIATFLLGLVAGWAAGNGLTTRAARYWEDRARELERREQGHLQTILELRRAGHELPPEEPPYEAPYVITDEFSAQVHEERTGRARVHEELVRQVLDDED